MILPSFAQGVFPDYGVMLNAIYINQTASPFSSHAENAKRSLELNKLNRHKKKRDDDPFDTISADFGSGGGFAQP